MSSDTLSPFHSDRICPPTAQGQRRAVIRLVSIAREPIGLLETFPLCMPVGTSLTWYPFPKLVAAPSWGFLPNLVSKTKEPRLVRRGSDLGGI